MSYDELLLMAIGPIIFFSHKHRGRLGVEGNDTTTFCFLSDSR